MNIKEKLKKMLDEQRLDREIKAARKKIADKEKEKVQVVRVSNEKNEEKNFTEPQNIEQNNEINQDKDTKKYKFSLERLKDAGLVAVAVMLIGIGYANFSGKDGSDIQNQVVQTSSEYSNNLGDVQLVNSEEASLVENDNTSENSTSQETNAGSNETENTIVENAAETTSANETINNTSSNNVSEYFTELKLDRDNMYSQKLEAYQKIVDSTAISSEQKAIAIQEIEKITETQNAISVAEELIKLKGFENVVIYVNDNSVTVIVRSANLTSDQVAQIQNIVTRQLGVSVSNISISNK